MAIILITHDLGVVARMADHVNVMYAGEIVEQGTAHDIFYRSAHPYTLGLRDAMPSSTSSRAHRLQPIEGSPPDLFAPPVGCGYFARCPHAMQICRRRTTAGLRGGRRPLVTLLAAARSVAPERRSSSRRTARARFMNVLISADKLTKNFPIGGGQIVHALDEVSLSIAEREVVGLVGESGSGKSTFGKTLIGLHEKTSGTVVYRGETLPQKYAPPDFQRNAQRMQMVFQDPYSSLEPTHDGGRNHRRRVEAASKGNDRPDPRARRRVVASRRSRTGPHVALPARILRRAATTHRHRARADSRAGIRRLRRTDLRARCFGAGAGREPARRTEVVDGADAAVHRARPVDGSLRFRSNGRDVSRIDHRNGSGGSGLLRTAASVLAVAGRVESRTGSDRRALAQQRRDRRRNTVAGEHSSGLPVRQQVSEGDGRLSRYASAAETAARRLPKGWSPVTSTTEGSASSPSAAATDPGIRGRHKR